LALVGTVLPATPAAADENRFAVVTVRNETRDVTVHFQYRWGSGAWTEFKNFRPGQAEWFAIPLAPGGGAPRFEIKINEAIGKAQPIRRTFILRWKPAPDRGVQFGHQHVIRRDCSNRDYIGVYDTGR
jgi:hypothetical protein